MSAGKASAGAAREEGEAWDEASATAATSSSATPTAAAAKRRMEDVEREAREATS